VTRAWLLRRLVGDGRRHGGVWVALVGAFAVVAFAAAGARALGRAAAPPAPPATHVIAYLDDGLDAPGVAELQRVLATLAGVEAVRAVSARESLEVLRRDLGARAGVLEGVGPELLPPTLEIVARPAAASALAFRLRRLRGVADVDLVTAPADAMAPHGDPRRPVCLGVALAGALGLLALVAALALLRARLRVELGLWLTLGLTRAGSVRPALALAAAAAAVGVALGGFGASWASRPWLGVGALPAREVAVGAAALLVLALAASRVALRVPEAAGAR
jgi:FtsX-like permease family protein